jgi:hypothetical protein
MLCDAVHVYKIMGTENTKHQTFLNEGLGLWYFNNISAISWSVLLVEETGVSGEIHRPATSH